jgi:hypothetical protein
MIPHQTNLVHGGEKPHVPRIGLSEKRAEPIGSLFEIRRGKTRFQIAYRGIGPPKEVRFRIVLEQRLCRRR